MICIGIRRKAGDAPIQASPNSSNEMKRADATLASRDAQVRSTR